MGNDQRRTGDLQERGNCRWGSYKEAAGPAAVGRPDRGKAEPVG